MLSACGQQRRWSDGADADYPEIRRKIRRKNKTHAKAKKTGSSKLRSKFETLRKEIKADVRKQHNLYVNNLVGDVKANPREFYRYINSQKKDTQGIPPLKRKNGKGVAQSDLEKAEEFNGQFTDVFSKNEHTQVPLLDRSAPFMNDIAVSKDGVIKLLKGLNPSKALGPDELHPRVLKELATELGPVFAHLFQQSIDTGEIPKEWSLANICPLFKKSDRSLACNYRPVSMTSVPCKLLEHIVCSNIMAHLDEYKLLSDRQHAFRKGHSCETQLTTVINDWAKILHQTSLCIIMNEAFEIERKLACIHVIVRLYQEILHIWKLFADEEKNALSLTNGIQNNSKILNFKKKWFLMTNTTVIPRIKNTNMVSFFRIPRRHASVLLRIQRLSWIVSMNYS